jgi:hypothetical protein
MTTPTEEEIAALSINEQGYLRALRTYQTSPPQDWRSEACLGIMDRCLAALDDAQKARVLTWADQMQQGNETETS